MDLDSFQETSLFSLDDVCTEDILVNSDNGEPDDSFVGFSTFKKTSKNSCGDMPPKSSKSGEDLNQVQNDSDFMELMSEINDNEDGETEFSNSRPLKSFRTDSNKSKFAKSSFSKKQISDTTSENNAIIDFIKQSSDGLIKSNNTASTNEFQPAEDQLKNLTTSVDVKVVKRTPKQPVVHNIVGTADLKCKLDLKNIALNARNTEYNPKRFDAAVMKIRSPRTTALIFSSGKIVCSGARSEHDSRHAAKKFAKTLKNMGYPVKFTNFKIVNMVAAADVGFDISLPALSVKHSEYCEFEPEIFAGLIYRIYCPKVTLMIFSTGKINIVGATSREDIHEAYQLIMPILKNYQRSTQCVGN